ncbi:TylF/MycF/NovP-related O-methyltransferase [Prosthecobacter sp.]|uniref:TylF/MycF/NovP-related O-methyltransferase n=1 Tax=Prosthecobacter sp. TaxID=1965333 RepID=UPI003784AE22
MKELAKNFIKTLRKKPSKDADMDPRLKKVRKNTMCPRDALESILRISETVRNAGIPGDIVECGVCNGGTAALFGSVVGLESRKLWLYDSFEGMPETTEADGTEAAEWVGKCVGSEETVKKILADCNVPKESTVIRKGWFEDTFKQPLPEKVALLHVDADWHSSVTLCLDTFFDRVVPGGYIILDDFGYWEGCREAFYDFCARRGIKPLLERAGIYQAHWIKGEMHHRPASNS